MIVEECRGGREGVKMVENVLLTGKNGGLVQVALTSSSNGSSLVYLAI